jgi:hypothetical protein
VRKFIAILIVFGLACSAPLNGPHHAPEAATTAPAQDAVALIDHIAPKPDSVGGVPPRFEWTAVKGADHYVIGMWNDIDSLLWKQRLNETSVKWPEQLKVDEGTYFWVVQAIRGEHVIGDSGRAAFVILDKK